MDVVAYVERAMGMFILAAAREVAFSPSACARQCIAEGEKPKGRAICISLNKIDPEGSNGGVT
jgi:hypothetical protein